VAEFSLSPNQRDQFDRDGFLRLEGLLSGEPLRAARPAVLRPLERLGLWRSGEWRLEALEGRKLKAPRAIGNRHPELQALVDQPPVRAVVGALLDAQDIDHSIYRRPQVLFTPPNAKTWTLPNEWHTDSPRLASGRRVGLQLFTFLEAVAPGGGGTLVVAGSHRLLNEGRHIRMKGIRPLLCKQPFFRDLYASAPRSEAESREVMGRRARVDGVELSLAELEGAPGDVYFTDMRLLHSKSPNASDRPRLMLTHRFFRSDAIVELAEAFGWQ
jgi:ectoine hydroxylase-related dioxygenase (phytanoyl-CoA dioxygenase family)